MITAKPLISVVIPAYNSADFIGEALASVVEQDYEPIEIIVVDDGSTDNTRDIVAQVTPSARLLKQANKGSGAARNLGIQAARGEYIAFLDADDVWWRHKIRTQVAALQASGHRMAYSRFIWWRPDPMTDRFPDAQTQFDGAPNPNLSDSEVVSGSPYVELLFDCIVWTTTVIVERSAFEMSGMFDEALRKGQDYDLWLRLSRHVSMLGMEQPTALYRIHEASITGSVRDVSYEYLLLNRAVERWGGKGPDGREAPVGLLAERLGRSIFNHGLAHLKRGDAGIAAQAFARSMDHTGWRLKPWALRLRALAKSWLTQAGK